MTTDCDRASTSVTNGRAYALRSAHAYTMSEERLQRAADHAMPPFSLSHFTCSPSSTSVLIDGVLSVWFFSELSIAEVSDRNGGIHRRAPSSAQLRLMPSARWIAAGERIAIHRPPSEPKAFCGEK